MYQHTVYCGGREVVEQIMKRYRTEYVPRGFGMESVKLNGSKIHITVHVRSVLEEIISSPKLGKYRIKIKRYKV